MRWELDVADERMWEGLLVRAERCALQQGWAYGAAVEGQGHGVRRAVLRDGGHCLALAQMVRRRLPLGLGLALLLRGPAWLEPGVDGEREAAALAGLRASLPRSFLIWQPDDARGLDRRAGWRRIWTGPSTAWLDLRLPEATLRARLDARWRNRLAGAEAAPLTVVEAGRGPALDWLVAADERQRRARGYRGPSAAFLRALARSGPSLVLVARHEGVCVAGILLPRHGRSATYHVGVTTETGRRLRAHQRLLWEGIRRLRQDGCTGLDLGGIDTVTRPGIARFKLALGGRTETLAGSYLAAPAWR